MKAVIIILALLSTFVYCQNKGKMRFAVKVVDDTGLPISTCEVGVITIDRALGENPYIKKTAHTNLDGIANFNLKSIHNRVSYGATAPDGYYRFLGQEFFFESQKLGAWQPENKMFEVVLKRKVNPIAMYAKKAPRKPPAFGVSAGYDFKIGDWVSPYGKGLIKDIIFRMDVNEIKANDFTSILTVTFPNKGDGMVAFEAPIEQEQISQFRSAYQAPDKGYIKSLIHNWVRKPNKPDVNTRKRTRNYYIRVRTKLDINGNVMSANYGKIYGDFMNFTHYLNPTPNDKNIEFDPKKNLIDTGYRGHKVQKP